MQEDQKYQVQEECEDNCEPVMMPQDPVHEGTASLVELLYGIITQPGEVFRQLAKTPKVLWGLLVFYGVNLFDFVLGYALARPELTNIPPGLPLQLVGVIPTLARNLFLAFLIFIFFFSGAMWFVASGVFSLLAQLLGGNGNGKGLLSAMGFAVVPGLFSALVEAVVSLLGLPRFISMVTALGVGIWILVLQVLAIRDTQSISGGRAALVFFLPLIVLFIAGMVIMAVLVSSLLPLIKAMSGSFPVL